MKTWKVFAITAGISWFISVAFGVSMFLHFIWPATFSWKVAYATAVPGVLLLYLAAKVRKPPTVRRETDSDLSHKRGTWAAAALGCVGIACLLVILLEYMSERRNVGSEGHIVGEIVSGQTLYRFQDFMPAFLDPSTPYAFGKLSETEREAKKQEFESSGQILWVLKGTRVQVLDREFLGPLYQVRFLDGPRKDGTAWVSVDELVLKR